MSTGINGDGMGAYWADVGGDIFGELAAVEKLGDRSVRRKRGENCARFYAKKRTRQWSRPIRNTILTFSISSNCALIITWLFLLSLGSSMSNYTQKE
jgi:hypothetical protein